MLTSPGPVTFMQRNEHSTGGVGPGMQKRLRNADTHRGSIFITGQAVGATGRPYGEIGGGPRRLGAGTAERGDAGHHQCRVVAHQCCGIQAQCFQVPGGEGLQHHIGVAHQGQDVRSVFGHVHIECARALAPAVGPPPQAAGTGNTTVTRSVKVARGSEWRHTSGGGPTRRFHGQHVGPQMGQQIAGEDSSVVAQIKHPQRLQHIQMMFRASSVGAADSTSPSTVTMDRQSPRLVAQATKLCALVMAVGR